MKNTANIFDAFGVYVLFLTEEMAGKTRRLSKGRRKSQFKKLNEREKERKRRRQKRNVKENKSQYWLLDAPGTHF